MAMRQVRAPPSRIYSSEPRMRQRRFPARVTAIREHGPVLSAQHQRQQTLTQLDFFDGGESDSDNTGYPDELQGGMEPMRPRKRRRTSLSKEEQEQRQKTLTQMGALLKHVPDSEESGSSAESGYDEDGRTAVTAQQDSWHNPFGHNTRNFAHVDIKEERSASSLQSTSGQMAQPPKSPRTPMKPAPKVIPSSQSPSDTGSPLESLNSRCSTPSPSQRTALREIDPNVLAMRDEMSIERQHLMKKRRLTSAPLCPGPYRTDENFEPSRVDNVNQADKTSLRHGCSSIASQLSLPPSSDGTADASNEDPSSPQSPVQVPRLGEEHMRSSQATTADTTPAFVHHATPFKKPLLPSKVCLGPFDRPPSPSSPTIDQDTFCSKYDSQLRDETMPLLNDTVDIVTASQLLMSSSPTA